MRYEKWKCLSPRQKACWPASDKSYLHPQHRVSISLDADLAQWFIDNVVGASSYTHDLEETIITALRRFQQDVKEKRRASAQSLN